LLAGGLEIDARSLDAQRDQLAGEGFSLAHAALSANSPVRSRRTCPDHPQSHLRPRLEHPNEYQKSLAVGRLHSLRLAAKSKLLIQRGG
jgi:hypothetical protein